MTQVDIFVELVKARTRPEGSISPDGKRIKRGGKWVPRKRGKQLTNLDKEKAKLSALQAEQEAISSYYYDVFVAPVTGPPPGLISTPKNRKTKPKLPKSFSKEPTNIGEFDVVGNRLSKQIRLQKDKIRRFKVGGVKTIRARVSPNGKVGNLRQKDHSKN